LITDSEIPSFFPCGNPAAGVVKESMKTLQVEIPDQMAREVENVVEAGKFENPAEVVRAALREFIFHRRFELLEQQHLSDISWALQESAVK
jgi:Arc/MetJ-type ribon-helix-helix transcriptional regulator